MKNITDFNEYSKVWKMYTQGPKIRYTINTKPPKQGIKTTKNVKIVDIAYRLGQNLIAYSFQGEEDPVNVAANLEYEEYFKKQKHH